MVFAITGATGFIGVHIIHHLLSNEHQVKAIKRHTSSLSEFELIKNSKIYNCDYAKLNWIDCELDDVLALEDTFAEVDCVIHTAGVISYLKKDLEKLLLVNKIYTAYVVNACLAAGNKKLIYISSIAAITKTGLGEEVFEDVEWDSKVSHSNYGLSKYLGECEVLRGGEEGLPISVINPGVVLGYGDWNKGSNKLFLNAYKEFSFYSNGATGFVGVGDIARICLQLAELEIKNERYLAVSENLSYKEVASLMAKNLDKKPPAIEVAGMLYNLSYLFVTIKELLGLGGLLSKETVKASVAKSYFSNSKIRNALNFFFTPMSVVIKNATVEYKKSPPK